MEIHDVAGIKMSLIYDLRPRIDGLGSVSGSPSMNTLVGIDELLYSNLAWDRCSDINIVHCRSVAGKSGESSSNQKASVTIQINPKT